MTNLNCWDGFYKTVTSNDLNYSIGLNDFTDLIELEPFATSNSNILINNNLSEHTNETDEIKNLGSSVETDLNLAESTYAENLKFSLENNSVEIELCYENIITNINLCNDRFVKRTNGIMYQTGCELSNGYIYDIYLKIEKLHGEFEKNDLTELSNFVIRMMISELYYESYIQRADFITCCILELIKGNSIQSEPNIIYLKIFDFNKLRHGFACYCNQKCIFVSDYIDLIKINKYNKYKIDIITSSKKLNNVQFSFEQKMTIQQTHKITNVFARKKCTFPKVSDCVNLIFLTFIKSKLNKFTIDDINNIDSVDSVDSIRSLRSIIMYIDDFKPIVFNINQLIKVNFCDFTTFVICADPRLKDKKTFCSYIKSDYHNNNFKFFNFVNIDKIMLAFDFDFVESEFYDVNICCLCTSNIKCTNGSYSYTGNNKK